MTQTYIESHDKEIKADKKLRKENGLVVERNDDKREIL